MKIKVYTIDYNGREYCLPDATGLQWFAHYGPDGSGFGYLTWRVRRRVGFDYADLGYGFPVELRKGPWRCLFSGQITRITERSGAGDEIEVWALGWVHTASANTYNYVYADTRYTEWISDETPEGLFRPDRFDWDTNDRLYLKPRRGVHDTEDYTYLRYSFGFGEIAARITAHYEIELPTLFPARVEVRADDTVLWSTDVTSSGSLDLTTTETPTSFEIRLYLTEEGEVTAEDDTVYALFEDVVVWSVNLSVLDAKVIADDVLAQRLVAHGLSADTRRVYSPGRALLPAYFDTDKTCAEVLTWLCQFGDMHSQPLAWGVTFDTTRRLFLENVSEQVRYIVNHKTANLERGGDWSESAQAVYGVYTDDSGQMRRTADIADAALIEHFGGHYRRQAVSLEVTRPEQAMTALEMWLREHGRPQLSGSFIVTGNVMTPDKRRVAFDEVQPGGQVQISEWYAVEATLTQQNFQERVTTFPLVGVRVDYDAGTVELIPAETSDAFARYMAVITQLVEQY